MIKLWIYNELAEDMDAFQGTASLYLPRPNTPDTISLARINEELVEISSWGNWDLTDTVNGTYVPIGSVNKPIRRGVGSTGARRHKKGSAVWIEWNPKSILPEDIESGSPLGMGAQTDDDVHMVISDGKGGWFIAGAFTEVDGVPRDGIARINPAGFLDTEFEVDIVPTAGTPFVSSIALSPDGEYLIISGNMDTTNGGIGGIAIVRTSNGQFVRGFIKDDFDTVKNMVWLDDYIYLGGVVTEINGTFYNGLARLVRTGNDWDLDTSWDPELNGFVTSLYAGRTQIYVGFEGSSAFQEVRLGAFGITYDGVLTGWAPNITPFISGLDAIAEDPVLDRVYLGGGFSAVNSASMNNLSVVDTVYGDLRDLNAQPDASVTVLKVLGDRLLVGGAFNNIDSNPTDYLATIDKLTGDLENDFALDDIPRWAAVSDAAVAIGGDFNTPRDHLLIYKTDNTLSPIGRYKLEGLFQPNSRERLLRVKWNVYKNFNLIYDGSWLNEFEPTREGTVISGPDISLPDPSARYHIEMQVVTDQRSYTETVGFGNRTNEAIYLIPIGVERGHRYDESDDLTLSDPVKTGQEYELNIPDEADTPVMMATKYFYKVYAILVGDGPDRKGGDRFTMTRSIGAVTEIENVPYSNLYSAVLEWEDQNAPFTLGLEFADSISLTAVGVSITHPGDESDKLIPDQVQVEREVDTGTLVGPQFGRFISDWVSLPPGGVYQLVYNLQGPTSYLYRYRVRYRDFRRDGVEDERGPVQILSKWSNWTTWS